MAQDTTQSQEKKAEPNTKGISHIGLAVTSIEKSYDNFWSKIGFKEVANDPNYPAKFLSDGTVILSLWQIDEKVNAVKFNRKENVGLHHVALKVASKEKLYEMYNIIKDLSDVTIEFEPQEIKGVGWWHCMCYEPNGIRVEFTWHG